MLKLYIIFMNKDVLLFNISQKLTYYHILIPIVLSDVQIECILGRGTII